MTALEKFRLFVGRGQRPNLGLCKKVIVELDEANKPEDEEFVSALDEPVASYDPLDL